MNMFEDVEGDVLVLDLFDKMPEHQRGDRAFRPVKQKGAVLDQHMSDGQRHGFKAFRIGEIEFERSVAPEPGVVGGKPGLDRFDDIGTQRLQLVIELAMLAVMRRFLCAIEIEVTHELRVGDEGPRLAHRLDEIRLEIGHGERRRVDDLRKFRPPRIPVQRLVARMSERHAPHRHPFRVADSHGSPLPRLDETI